MDVELLQADNELKAAKARLRRLCEVKSGGKLKVPEWLHDAWKSGDKTAMASAYKSAGFDKDRCFLVLCVFVFGHAVAVNSQPPPPPRRTS